jgi:light-independent protochlorophyllide reductase subunit B
MARVARDEMGFEVVGLGAYNREFARQIRAAAKDYGVEPLITDDYLEVEAAIAEAAPEMILGTQMERHIGKRLGIPCAVISAPFHVQDHPARYSPVMGWEGANVLFDTMVHPLVMGLEEHLLAMFREDFEFSDEAGPSHLGGHAPATPRTVRHDDVGTMSAQMHDASPTNGAPESDARMTPAAPESDARGTDAAPAPHEGMTDAAVLEAPVWTPAGEKELKKIPFFVRGKARRNTETYAAERGITEITVETLYDAKAHFAR